MTKDGPVDYAAAFNKRFGKGVTPQNNAAVPLLILFRPESFRGDDFKMVAGKAVAVPNKQWGHRFRKALGISLRDLTGPRYIPLQVFLMKADYTAIPSMPGSAGRGAITPGYMRNLARWPWSATANPLVAAWLRANEGALDIAAVAFARSRFFLPIIRARARQGMFAASVGTTGTRLNRLLDDIVQVLGVQGALNQQLSLTKLAARLRSGHELPTRVVTGMQSALSDLIASESRGTSGTRIDKLCFALAAYLDDHGAFPARLAQLAPKYLLTIPRDPFTGKPFRYTAGPTGCTISSPGEFPPQLFPGSQLPQGPPLIVHLPLPPGRASK